jgi:hypothetical protein
MIGPIGGKDLKRFSTQQQIKGLTHLFRHNGAEELIKVGNGPAAELKVPAGIFGGTARSLHHAIQAKEGKDDNFSHGNDSTRGDQRKGILDPGLRQGCFVHMPASNEWNLWHPCPAIDF